MYQHQLTLNQIQEPLAVVAYKPDYRLPVLPADDSEIEALFNSDYGQHIASLYRRYLYRHIQRGNVLADPDAVRHFLTAELRDEEQEVFCVLFLDNRHRVISFDRMFYGTLNASAVHPREVVKTALKHNASAVLLAHNHPSGVAEPSQADERITQRLQKALELVDVQVLDHFIVGDRIVSFAEKRLI